MSTLQKNQLYKLIAIDLDGTLLNREHKISKENQEAIAEAADKGIKVVISTGRGVESARECMEFLQISSYLVTVNGSEVWDPSGKLIEENPLRHDFVKMMWDLSNQHGTRFLAVASDSEYRKDLPKDITEHQWLKFDFSLRDMETKEAILTELEKNSQLEISNSGTRNIEVNALGINKAKGLRKVCESIGITMDQVIAIGDSLNDLSMIKEAGCGVAMGNAQDLVKESADWITETNEADGVAKAIRHWVLNE